MGTGALCNRTVLIVRTGEFVCQCVTDKCACGCTDQALKQPASCGLVVNILLSVFAGNGLAIVAVGLRFGRDGVLYGFGSELVNGIVLLAVLLCQLLLQRFNLFCCCSSCACVLSLQAAREKAESAAKAIIFSLLCVSLVGCH